ncbi:hypothetical protein ACIRPX_41690 [Streptomyces sp. NPDC101225]|uniref:hypothetical protein n=1 Tax=Streptomyces sp. NPDC101225 TaxID=3366135 RepID=UPI003821095B
MLVVQALVTGATAGLGDAASAAVTDSYQALRGALVARLSGRPEALERIRVLERRPTAPTGHLVHDLAVTGAVDPHVVEHARRLLALVDGTGTRGAGPIDLRHAQGVQAGNDNTQHNTFG